LFCRLTDMMNGHTKSRVKECRMQAGGWDV
jgi:hypothetical protein